MARIVHLFRQETADPGESLTCLVIDICEVDVQRNAQTRGQAFAHGPSRGKGLGDVIDFITETRPEIGPKQASDLDLRKRSSVRGKRLSGESMHSC